MSYRSDVDALAARHDALAAEVADKTRELDSARRLLDEARARARVPVLPNIRVASPCSADWSQMTGDERVRACGACNKDVYNLSTMTRDEAESLIAEREGRLCVRYYQRPDGTILLADCTIGAAQKRKRRLIAAGAAALLATGGLLAIERGRSSAPVDEREVIADEAEPIQGVMLEPEPPPVDTVDTVDIEDPPRPHVRPIATMGKLAPVDDPAAPTE